MAQMKEQIKTPEKELHQMEKIDYQMQSSKHWLQRMLKELSEDLHIIKKTQSALAGVAQWIECRPTNQRVTGSIPSQGTHLGCGPGPHWRMHERQPHIDVSLPLFLSSPLSKNK